MKKNVKKSLGALVVAGLMAVSGAACAKNLALILWIGQGYAADKLDGIDKDAKMARRIALSMGVSESNIKEYSDRQLTLGGLKSALVNFENTVAAGDKVFIYYSGHGTQIPNEGGGGQCTEGMVSSDLDIYKDSDFQEYLENLSRRAGQVIVMNDSCYSGGQATKAVRSGRATKFMSPSLIKSAHVAAGDNYVCNKPANFKSLGSNVKSYGANFVYIAASSAREVSFPTMEGSVATVAWNQCLTNYADTNRSGTLTAEEIASCAQKIIRQGPPSQQQTITVIGNSSLPLSFALDNNVINTSPAAMLNDYRAAASPNIRVDLQVQNTQLRIKQPGRPGDRLYFTVNTRSAGYLYLLYSSSNEQNIDVLFPNARDNNNYVQPGSYSLPRASWGIEAGGPAGTGYLMAIVSPEPMSFSSGGEFKATSSGARKLLLTGPQGGAAYGASQVIGIQEFN